MQPCRSESGNPVVAEIASLGQYFAFETHDRLHHASGWLPMGSLVDGSDALPHRYGQVRSALAAMAGVAAGDVEFRVAASVGQLGLVARLLCPVFGARLLGYGLPLDQARWRPVIGGVLPLSLPLDALTGVAPTSGRTRSQLPGQIRALVGRTADLSVSPQVLWGNVASAINGAVRTVTDARPDLAAAAATHGRDLLAEPELRGAGTGTPGQAFRRHSCCLIYRIAASSAESREAGTFCGDCVLR